MGESRRGVVWKDVKSYKGKCSRVEFWGGLCVIWDIGFIEVFLGLEIDFLSFIF